MADGDEEADRPQEKQDDAAKIKTHSIVGSPSGDEAPMKTIAVAMLVATLVLGNFQGDSLRPGEDGRPMRVGNHTVGAGAERRLGGDEFALGGRLRPVEPHDERD